MNELLPPILQTPGLVVADVGVLDGKAYIKLVTTGRTRRPVREVVIFVQTAGVFEYTYAIYDESIAQVVTYSGPYGDPERDTWVSNKSLRSHKP